MSNKTAVDHSAPKLEDANSGVAWVETLVGNDDDRVSGKWRDEAGVQHQFRGTATNGSIAFEIAGREGTILGMGRIVAKAPNKKGNGPLGVGTVAFGETVHRVCVWPCTSNQPGKAMVLLRLDDHAPRIPKNTTHWG